MNAWLMAPLKWKECQNEPWMAQMKLTAGQTLCLMDSWTTKVQMKVIEMASLTYSHQEA
jgi:hypothetical protein